MSLVESPSRAAAFEHLLAAAADPILIVDAAGAPLRANAAARRLVPTCPPRDARSAANLEALRAFALRPDRTPLTLHDLAGEGEPVAYTVSALADAGELVLVLRDPRERIPAGASHELRSPLTAILGYASLLLRGLGGSLSPKQRDKLERIHSNGQRLLQLIDERRA